MGRARKGSEGPILSRLSRRQPMGYLACEARAYVHACVCARVQVGVCGV